MWLVIVLYCLSNDSGGSWGSNGVSSSGKSWGSSVGGSNSWGSSSISNTGNSWGSSDSGNWGVRDSVDWGGVSSHNSLGGVGLNGGVVDVWGLDNLLDWVDLVWSWDMDGSWDWDLVWLGNWLLNNDLTGNSSWDGNWDINVVFVDLDLWDDVGDLWGDSGVGSDWGSNSGLGHGISWGRTSWDWCRWDGSIWCWGSWDSWGWEGSGLNEVLWGSGNIRGGWLGDSFMSGNSVLVSSNNGSDSSLDGSLSNDTVFNSVLNNSWSSGVAVVGLSNNSRGVGNSGTDNGTSTNTGVSQVSNSDVGGSSSDTGHEGTGNHKSVHVFLSCSEVTPM